MAGPAADGDLVGRRDAFVERLFEAALGAFDLFAVYLGDRLGLLPGARGRWADDFAGARRADRDERAVRPGVAGAAGDCRHP